MVEVWVLYNDFGHWASCSHIYMPGSPRSINGDGNTALMLYGLEITQKVMAAYIWTDCLETGIVLSTPLPLPFLY